MSSLRHKHNWKYDYKSTGFQGQYPIRYDKCECGNRRAISKQEKQYARPVTYLHLLSYQIYYRTIPNIRQKIELMELFGIPVESLWS